MCGPLWIFPQFRLRAFFREIVEAMSLDTDIEAGMEAINVATIHDQLPKLSRQETEFAATLAATGDVATAGKKAGLDTRKANILAKNPSIQAHVDHILANYRRFVSQNVTYTLADAHADIELGKKMASNATEWFKGVEMHMRLHGLDTKKTEVNVNVTQITSRQQLENLEDSQIMEMAGFSYADLLPEAIEGEVIDGEE